MRRLAVDGAREAVVDGENGYVLPPGDDELMAERITRLLRDPDRARIMGQQGRRRVEEKFSCQARAARTLDLYESLLAQRRRPAGGR